MCSVLNIKQSPKEVSEWLQAGLFDQSISPENVYPGRQTPVALDGDEGREVQFMRFGLVPVWTQGKPPRFSTHNARVETVATLKSYRGAFASRRCLVPLSEFIEPCYSGTHAGQMVRFFSHDRSLLTAAGIWEKSGDVVSFSVITTEPDPFVKETGHDRTPLFLRREGFGEWVEGGKREPEDLLDCLREFQAEHVFGVERERDMKAGWDKRKRRR